jgi:hypothetical protein
MERKPISKRTRFEIFKRDGFRCAYCGRTPVESPLHVDHVEAVANGGENDPANLVTACADCNLGKSDVPLERKQHATGKVTDADRDHAEQIREYLAVQREIASARREVVEALIDHWIDSLQTKRYPRDLPARLASALREWSVPELMEAISIVGAKFPCQFGDCTLRYLYGILRNWREQARIARQRRDEEIERLMEMAEPCPKCGLPTPPGAACSECPEAIDA